MLPSAGCCDASRHDSVRDRSQGKKRCQRVHCMARRTLTRRPAGWVPIQLRGRQDPRKVSWGRDMEACGRGTQHLEGAANPLIGGIWVAKMHKREKSSN